MLWFNGNFLRQNFRILPFRNIFLKNDVVIWRKIPLFFFRKLDREIAELERESQELQRKLDELRRNKDKK